MLYYFDMLKHISWYRCEISVRYTDSHRSTMVSSAMDSMTLPVVFKSWHPYFGTPILHLSQSLALWYGWRRLKRGTGWSGPCHPRMVCRLPGLLFPWICHGTSEGKDKLKVHCLWVSYHNARMPIVVILQTYFCGCDTLLFCPYLSKPHECVYICTILRFDESVNKISQNLYITERFYSGWEAIHWPTNEMKFWEKSAGYKGGWW